MHDQTFLQASVDERTHKRQRRRMRFHALWVSFLTVFVAWIVLFCIALGQAFAKTMDGRDALLKAETLTTGLQFEQAKTELENAKRSFSEASSGLVFVKTIGVIPYIQTRVTEVDRLLTSGIDVVDSLSSLLTIGQDLVQLSGLSDAYFKSLEQQLSPSVSFDDLPTETKRLLLQRLSASAEDLELLTTRIHVSRSELELLGGDLGFPSVFGFIGGISKQLLEAESELKTLNTLARIFPEFAGLEQEKTHLVLLLNNDELRPGGGFIGTYGVLRVQDGEIRSLKTSDVYALDRFSEGQTSVKAPEPMRLYNAADALYLRDANWSPDFAVSSLNVIAKFLEESAYFEVAQQGNPSFESTEQAYASVPVSGHLDGVIGMTPELVSGLLSITGPLTVSGEVFNAENVAEKIEYQVERGFAENGIPYPQRKEILSDLVTELRRHVLALPVSDWKRVLAVAEQSFEQKHLFLYSAHSATEDVISRVGWGGRVQPTTTDVQLVVDANLASLKSDPEVKRTITYQISKNSTGQYLGRTTIRYRHEGSFDWRTTRYRTYTRLYLPKGTRFIRAQGTLQNDKTKNATLTSGNVDVSEDLELSVFGAFTAIEPGQTGELSFDYELAPQVVEAIHKGTYQLSVLKQNGARDYALTLGLDFGKKVSDASPAEDRKDWGNTRYELNTILDHDKTFQVNL